MIRSHNINVWSDTNQWNINFNQPPPTYDLLFGFTYLNPKIISRKKL